MKRWYVLSLLCISVLSIHFSKAQHRDSILLKQYEAKRVLHDGKKQYDSAIVFTGRALTHYQQLGDTLNIAESNFRLGYYHKKLEQLEVAFSHYNEAFKIFRDLPDSARAGGMLRSMANIQKGLGDLTGSQTTAINGLGFLANSQDTARLAGLHHIISVTFKEQGNQKEAMKWSNKVMQLINGSDRVSAQSKRIYKNTRANIQVRLKQYNAAISLFTALLQDQALVPESHEQARLMDNLGYSLWIQDSTNTRSEPLMLRALEIREHLNSISGLVSSHTHLSKYYNTGATKNKALFHAQKALANAKKERNGISIMETLDLVIPLKKELGAPLRAEAQLYSITQNNISKAQQKIRSVYAVTQYENDKLTNANLLLKAEKAEKDLQNAVYLVGLGIALIAIAFVVYWKNQQRQRARMEAEYTTEIRVAKKIHDELGNDIFYLMTQIKKDSDLLPNDGSHTVLDGLKKVYEKARDISKEHTPIRTDETYGEELIDLMNSYGNESIKIITTKLEDGFWDVLPKEKKIQLFWVVRELMTNMRKYSKATFVGITFSKSKNQLEVNYNDNGIGFTNDPETWGNGLRYVENRIKNLKGSFNFDSVPDQGLTVQIKFPL